MKHTDTLLQEGAIKLERESGKGYVRDINADYLPRSLNADFDGDDFHYMGMERQARLTERQKLRRAFQNKSLTKKNAVRKIRREVKKATDRAGLRMAKNMVPMHPDTKLIFDSRLVK